ncbi:Fe-S cluster assembly ATPase SufC [Candidatus Liberibacter americanus]|uniref:Iron-sulfur cluster assembly ATPase protein SufC n=1 Tax=Candidatus Liberibacter americanus str. Sao Paulo TaxID=1261131 RepID=U6B4Y9_9HYPH|nr:Fe-S cluster assembly ATPase SufC [Candidatus Liberibacter americanus]AHA27965.1 Iron-sulfur cluster assembly ATPase protein SufC [Candidatus Liberibacter americanus str. Sao Paulo]EMS35859.1 ABC transporter nucleotide binding/ATPase protein [Candidatus Liberibacter americanus PW_SP]
MLEIKGLHAKIIDSDTEIIKGLDLKIETGEIAAIMGPNGSGKSTLSYILSGHKDYIVTSGDILYRGESILDCDIADRASKGIFLAFQYPVEIPGVVTMNFLKTALNEQRKACNKEEILTPDFIRKVREIAEDLGIGMDMLKRTLNVGFSGGEKKIAEILQMRLLEPSLCVLDETDSGLDIDALKVAANGVNYFRSKDRSFLIITHYQRLLNYIKPDTVHVLYNGRIVQTGDMDIAIDLEKNGYARLIKEFSSQ